MARRSVVPPLSLRRATSKQSKRRNTGQPLSCWAQRTRGFRSILTASLFKSVVPANFEKSTDRRRCVDWTAAPGETKKKHLSPPPSPSGLPNCKSARRREIVEWAANRGGEKKSPVAWGLGSCDFLRDAAADAGALAITLRSPVRATLSTTMIGLGGWIAPDYSNVFGLGG